MTQPRWHVRKSVVELQRSAVEWIASLATNAIAARGRFRLVLAGGETPRGVYELLRKIDSTWSAWEIWFGDERCLPVGDARRNSSMAEGTLFRHVAIPRDHIHIIRGELGAKAATVDYCAVLGGIGEFDLVLLGIGEDGHTASLFPSGEWGVSPDAPDVLAVWGAPKPLSERVSLSAHRLSWTRSALCLATGANKQAAIKAWREGVRLPVTAIQPPGGMDVLVEIICSGVDASCQKY